MRPRTKDQHLPQCVYLNKGIYYYVKNNVWHRVGRTLDADKLDRLRNFQPEKDTAALEQHIKNRLYQQKQESKNRGRDFDISTTYAISVAKNQGWVCALTGKPFSLATIQNMRIKPYAPSVDRIDNTKGYVVGNIRVVLACVNIARNIMDDDLLIDIASAITRENRKVFGNQT